MCKIGMCIVHYDRNLLEVTLDINPSYKHDGKTTLITHLENHQSAAFEGLEKHRSLLFHIPIGPWLRPKVSHLVRRP